MSKETRDRRIYTKYNTGKSVEELSNEYGLKLSTIKKIISRYNKLNETRKKFMDDLYTYLRDNNYPKLNSTAIYNSLWRAIISREIFKIEDIEDLIVNDVYMRGIGPKYREILKDYLDYRDK